MKKDPGLAAILSFFFPGVGQVYNGQVLRGIMYFVFCLLLVATGIGIIIFIPVWIYLIRNAYKVAQKT